ncbi:MULTISPECIES: 30S ribosomal protein S4 [unclassified Fusibacter]|uniref:30S ribosomal protein S4 n=1 Tax=unclassified Fusibacter TaxID=2624464 RepID=UPI0010125261|nr:MULTISPECIES: 30S ribosomal protein S4 [unclassified Fusibacter]MCK8060803.1 30S ribosomal protein S4 [Fusibacter sp. A2]NPE23099.1 30S ribosomal protein S4 [Fusibacter sp. A1]RXV59770.1 30S ribosomal protein S4 [Fusibacter sp. A1]
MARPRGPRFKEARSLGLNVHGHPKAMNRQTPSRADKKLSNYGKQLLEKQRLKAYYGMMEKQMRKFFKEASKEAVPVVGLIRRLELRLDNVVYRAGFGTTLRQARQMVGHGHVLVNGKRIDIPSYQVKVGDVLSLKEGNSHAKRVSDAGAPLQLVPYLAYDENGSSATLIRLPNREEIPIEIQDHLVTEFYSKMA